MCRCDIFCICIAHSRCTISPGSETEQAVHTVHASEQDREVSFPPTYVCIRSCTCMHGPNAYGFRMFVHLNSFVLESLSVSFLCLGSWPQAQSHRYDDDWGVLGRGASLGTRDHMFSVQSVRLDQQRFSTVDSANQLPQCGVFTYFLENRSSTYF